jgi:hypothetical protein
VTREVLIPVTDEAPLTASSRFLLHRQVTLATQCDSEEFVRRLPELARAWQGPMVVAVLVRTWEEAHNVSRALRGSPVLSKCETACRLTPCQHVLKPPLCRRHHVRTFSHVAQ